MKSNLYKQYIKDVVPALKEELGKSNIMEVPKISKVVVNVGYGRHNKDKSFIENVDNSNYRTKTCT